MISLFQFVIVSSFYVLCKYVLKYEIKFRQLTIYSVTQRNKHCANGNGCTLRHESRDFYLLNYYISFVYSRAFEHTWLASRTVTIASDYFIDQLSLKNTILSTYSIHTLCGMFLENMMLSHLALHCSLCDCVKWAMWTLLCTHLHDIEKSASTHILKRDKENHRNGCGRLKKGSQMVWSIWIVSCSLLRACIHDKQLRKVDIYVRVIFINWKIRPRCNIMDTTKKQPDLFLFT